MKSAKEYIREYERLLHEKPQDLQQKMQHEKEWMCLYKNIKRCQKKAGKRESKSIDPFVRKSLENAKKAAVESMVMVLDIKSKTARGFINENGKLYEKFGLENVMDHYCRQKGLNGNGQKRFDELKKEEQLSSIGESEWLESVGEVVQKKVHSIQEAFQLESQLLDMVNWYAKNGKKEHLSNLYQEALAKMDEIGSYVLKEWGYNTPLHHLFSKNTRKYYRKNGLIKALRHLESVHGSTPLVDEIQEKMSFRHPKEEFPSVREKKRHFIFHVGGTNSGKTYHAVERLKGASSGVYLAPIRLLAHEIKEKLDSNGIPCDLITGETIEIEKGANHRSSTIEVAPFQEDLEVAVIDEMQMIEDPERGYAWVKAVFGLRAKEIHLCGSVHAVDFYKRLIEECGDTYEVNMYERSTPLSVEEETFSYPYSIRKGDALIAFSRSKVMEIADDLKKRGYKVSVLYGKLPAETRKKQVRMFSEGQTDMIIATDAIGIGLNLPIRRVVFMETTKFDGFQKRPLTSQEVKQIGGRAGRKGRYNKGFINTVEEKRYIEEMLHKIEDPITEAVVHPGHEISDQTLGTMRQRLYAWVQVPTGCSYLVKSQMQNQLCMLERLEAVEKKLENEDIYKLLSLPFESDNYDYVKQWDIYIDELVKGKKGLTRPAIEKRSLSNMETYYGKLNLYYSFSKKFKMDINKEWVHDQRKRTSFGINGLLQHKRKYA
ncbi:RNA helicase (plasmid) [Pontibacillus sp. ALD_SL1]|uniref:helicase-related protein n=1 Tax=Pontibacillus sp. ALD_SL1 TaxID=2777185 RepID=UPI001A967AC7|nr:helicase-related protein [Pontibacillus sp. ALD_SL1]QST02089.1 RNA helicase [Pontibacillus sp. ALD_SL1]